MDRRDGRSPAGNPLDGGWRVERTGGLLPPMVGVRKRIRGARGETWLGPLPVWPFRSERRRGRATLTYRGPFSMLVDELHQEPDGSWSGRSTLLGLELGRFRMASIDHRKRRGKRGQEAENMNQPDRLRRKLVEYA